MLRPNAREPDPSPNIRSKVGWADGAKYNNTQLCMRYELPY